jgi:hypothetical protein
VRTTVGRAREGNCNVVRKVRLVADRWRRSVHFKKLIVCIKNCEMTAAIKAVSHLQKDISQKKGAVVQLCNLKEFRGSRDVTPL